MEQQSVFALAAPERKLRCQHGRRCLQSISDGSKGRGKGPRIRGHLLRHELSLYPQCPYCTGRVCCLECIPCCRVAPHMGGGMQAEVGLLAGNIMQPFQPVTAMQSQHAMHGIGAGNLTMQQMAEISGGSAPGALMQAQAQPLRQQQAGDASLLSMLRMGRGTLQSTGQVALGALGLSAQRSTTGLTVGGGSEGSLPLDPSDVRWANLAAVRGSAPSALQLQAQQYDGSTVAGSAFWTADGVVTHHADNAPLVPLPQTMVADSMGAGMAAAHPNAYLRMFGVSSDPQQQLTSSQAMMHNGPGSPAGLPNPSAFSLASMTGHRLGMMGRAAGLGSMPMGVMQYVGAGGAASGAFSPPQELAHLTMQLHQLQQLQQLQQQQQQQGLRQQ
uniref:Uncharacterized protein n=1 Tax=Chlamydomonas leiostraca TaxID=1034604 RepID=A0A7S0RRT6_9CHLO|mmetsp:Transcript_30021/g.76449  ORF Transcript_30021/g.76449 Transcript_30021/m.76449 type:complete len:387 (+) Transcript_30021:232-1392(+)